MMYDKMRATVKGTDCEGNRFVEELEFNMLPPKDNNYYGTGYYMNVKRYTNYYPKPMVELCDVRYEKTTDIEILADRYIKNYYGKNAEDIEKQFPSVCLD